MCTPNCERICFVALAEGADFVAQQVERAEHAFLVPKGHDELCVHAGHEAQISRILMNIVDEDCLFLGHRRPDDAFADLEAEVLHHVERITLGVRDFQHLSLVVEHVDGEHRERRQPGDEAGNAAKQLIEIEDGRYFAAELEQRGDEFLVLRTSSGFGHVVAVWRPESRPV